MRASKAARKFITANPSDPASRILAELVLSLANESAFKLADLYSLGPEHFTLAMDILNDWRLDRYYLGKAKLFDLSWRIKQLESPAAA
ncbi:MAG: hypothetical protein ABI919_14395 [Ramlibacter sp.]